MGKIKEIEVGLFVLVVNENAIYFDEYEIDSERRYMLYNKGLLIANIRYILLFDNLIEELKNDNKNIPNKRV